MADGRDGTSVYMDNQARRLVEDPVVLFVFTLEKLWCYLGFGDKASKPPESGAPAVPANCTTTLLLGAGPLVAQTYSHYNLRTESKLEPKSRTN